MIKPFPFHSDLRDYFKKQDKTWSWFSEEKVKAEQQEAFKTDLLKNSYRIDPETEPKVYEILNVAKDKLGIIVPITIYQSQSMDGNNAGVVFFENEAHIILSGTILKLLNEDELLVLFGHELSHILLFNLENGDFEITNRIINTIASDGSSELFYYETARLYQLYTELYCDLGALKVSGSLETTIQTLVKLNTGLEKVSAESYLKQANEILARIEKGSDGETHPENFIRAKALEIFEKDNANYYSKTEKIISGKSDLHQLNLFTKKLVFDITKELISIILKPKWTQSEYCTTLYKQYFSNSDKKIDAFIDDTFKLKIENSKKNLKEYYTYVMLDFALCDPDLKEAFIGHILDISEQLGLEDEMKTILKKELNLTEKTYKAFAQNCTSTLNTILESDLENTY
ncbi:M48 family metalloprotease [Flavobacterium sp. ANB]|uniref:M48 family metalloprotease n=1 Tax=unclassified Flavobacterium TaxID=196869 RepID=UPI0012B7B506|nr:MULTISPECIES: M48 family metalloprotease [unclassified Flavobacterium]MBF4517232.1 M48 family metalloprotease [Flavobacterium sp. ANB]MTD70609.1 M48 family metalloprotease [Flavobacterium sp. LC2016-13]